MKWVPRIAAVGRRDEDFGVLANSRFWPMLARDLRREVWTAVTAISSAAHLGAADLEAAPAR